MSRKSSTKVTAIAVGMFCIVAAAACVLSYATSRMDPFKVGEIGMLWFAAGSFVATGGSVIALVWTLYEQRKMTQNASRAVLEVKSIRIHPSNMDSFWLFFEVRNHGQTPAFSISASGTLTFAPEVSDSGERLGEKVAQGFQSSELGLVAPFAQGDMRYLCSDASEFLRLPKDAGRYPYIGTEHSRPPELLIKGVVIYGDVFEQRHELPFEMKMYQLDGETAFTSMTSGFIGG